MARPPGRGPDEIASLSSKGVHNIYDSIAAGSGRDDCGPDLYSAGAGTGGGGTGGGEAADDAVEAFLVEHFRAVQRGLKPLQASYAKIARGTDKPIWVLFSPRPFSTAFPKPLYLCIFALIMAIFTSINVSALLSADHVYATHFRVTPLPTAAAGHAVPVASLRVQVLLDGCRVPGLSANQTAIGPSVLVSYPEPVRANGVSLSMHAGHGAAPPRLSFELETSADGVEWAALALPGWVDRAADFRTAGQPVGADGQATLDLSVPWPWTLWAITDVGFDAMAYVAILAGWSNRGRLAAQILAAAYLGSAVLTLAAAAGCDRPPYQRLRFRAGQEVWIDVVFAAGVWTEVFMVELVVLGNLALVALHVYFSAVPSSGSGQSVIVQALTILGFLLASAFGGCLWVLRARAWAWIQKQVEEDERRYEAAFQALRDEGGGFACLDLVRQACEEMAWVCEAGPLHQRSGVDLDQLYSQAGFLHFVLKDKVCTAQEVT